MSTITALHSASSSPLAAAAADTATASKLPQKTLGQNDFLKLLATQFQTQDPMKPMEDTAFIAQMAQFSALEQSSSMAQEMAQLRSDQQRVTANSYLGHRVTVDNGDGTSTTGDVLAIDATGTESQLIVNGQAYSLSAVLRVEPSVVTTSPSANSGSA